jgi:hypothetical protein
LGKRRGEKYIAKRFGKAAARIFVKEAFRLNLIGTAAECGVELYREYGR